MVSSPNCRSPRIRAWPASNRSLAPGLIDREAERARRAGSRRSEFGLKAPSVLAEVGTLSGGNQQKVALARWLRRPLIVMIMDEPTQGIDVGSKAEIHALMQDLAERGLAIVMISSELPEILGMSDRVVVMRGGTVAGILSRSEATQERILGLTLQNHAEALSSRGVGRLRASPLLAAALAVVAPAYFARENLRDLFLANMPVLIVAIGTTLVILVGEIDISTGSAFAICAVVSGVVAKATGLGRHGGALRVRCRRGARRDERRSCGVRSYSLNRRDARQHGGAAGRTAVDHSGGVGRELAARASNGWG